MSHKKSWNCINPNGSGCDGNHTTETSSLTPDVILANADRDNWMREAQRTYDNMVEWRTSCLRANSENMRLRRDNHEAMVFWNQQATAFQEQIVGLIAALEAIANTTFTSDSPAALILLGHQIALAQNALRKQGAKTNT